jgi:hypothetical protein
MLQRILRKRTRVEKKAWEQVQNLMPRSRKTRGLQYIALEYLFRRLYERVPEEDIRNHLLEVKGHLQPTGDPVKGAINSAIKELQRLPDRPFEIVKIQEATLAGQRRYVKLEFTRFQEVIGFDLYREYLQEVLHNEKQIFIRAVSSQPFSKPGELFPGLTFEDLETCRGEFLVNPHADLPDPPDHCTLSYLPRSAANLRLLLVYEDSDQNTPFLGFVASVGIAESREELGFILYRGSEKLSKLIFLDQLWKTLAQTALDFNQLDALKEKAKVIAADIRDDSQDWYTIILDGLLAEAMAQANV